MNMDLTAARSWFDLDPALVFLNHGSYGALPRPVREAQAALADALESDPIRFMDAVPGRVAEVRAEVAGSLGARGEDLALVENATAGVSTVLRARRWSAIRIPAATIGVRAHFALAKECQVPSAPMTSRHDR